MKVLVIGGAGYIGSVLVPSLLHQGYDVAVVDNLMYRQSTLFDVFHSEQFSFVRGDIRDSNLLEELVPQHDVIIPLAAIVGAPACDRDPELATQVNLDAIRSLASIVSREQGLLFPVTNSGYGIGRKDELCDEDSPLKPLSLYGRTKVEAERILLDTGNCVTFRLATVFGVSPRMRLDLLVNDFVYKAFSDHSIVLFEAHFRRNFLHVRDAAKVFCFGIQNYEKLRGQPYNVGLSEANLTKLELCHRIRKFVPELLVLESDVGKDPDKRDYIVSNDKIEGEGWSPAFGLDAGIQELLKAYQVLRVRHLDNL